MEVENRKKCDSKVLKAVIAFFILFLVSQIKIPQISNLFSSTSPHVDGQVSGSSKQESLGLDPQAQESPSIASPILCNRSHFLYDTCSIWGPTVLDPKGPSLYAKAQSTSQTHIEKLQPYPRKWDIFKMAQMKEITLISGPLSPPCEVKHNASALIFNVGGYTGNYHTDFNEEFIPLFITFNSIFSNKDLILVISNAHDWWLRKYTDLLRNFTKHRIINLDKETKAHCFPSANVGLMSIDPKEIPNSKTILNFHALLKKLYAHDKDAPIIALPNSRPRLLLAERTSYMGRRIINRVEARQVAEEEGFDIIEFEPKYATTMREAYDLISMSHVMVGVYGAALTHLLSLRPGSIFIQIIPIGADWLADMHFGTWARDLGLDYLEYKIRVEESSLLDKYGIDDEMLRNPKGLYGKWGGWSGQSVETYLMDQDVKLDLVRFRRYLKKAYVKAKAFMQKEG